MYAPTAEKAEEGGLQEKSVSKFNGLKRLGALILAFLIVGLFFLRLKQFAKIEYWIYHPVNKGVVSEVAIEGFDPVSYFIRNFPEKGKERYTVRWKGATWQFSSPENSEIFKSNPEKYSPQYGGYCAYAVSQGFTFEIDPFQWYIKDGKLYLISNERTLEKWMKDREGLIKKADLNWRPVLDRKLTWYGSGDR